MSDLDSIDATKLFEYMEKGIANEDFVEAKAWINDNIEPRFARNPDKILEVKNSNRQTYY